MRLKWLAPIAILLFCLSNASQYDEPALIRIVRAAIRSEVTGTRAESAKTSKMAVKPVFVTIEVDGVIRGCRGSLQTRTSSLEEEIRLAAQAACQHDPRYRPLTEKELMHYLVTVTIVDGRELIQSVDGIKPEDGLALCRGSRWGIVLPWEGKDPHVRLKWAYQKAGVPIGESATLYKLSATRFRG